MLTCTSTRTLTYKYSQVYRQLKSGVQSKFYFHFWCVSRKIRVTILKMISLLVCGAKKQGSRSQLSLPVCKAKKPASNFSLLVCGDKNRECRSFWPILGEGSAQNAFHP